MLVKSDTTSKDTIHSLGAMVVRLMLSRNSRELVRLCSESAVPIAIIYLNYCVNVAVIVLV